MALKALLFDCDGVIAETERDGHRVAFNQTFESEGINAHWGVEEYGRLVEIGGGKERMLHYFRANPEKYPESRFTPEYVAELHKKKTAAFMALAPALAPRPGVKRLMQEAAAAGLQVFICSTSNQKSVTAIAGALLGEALPRVVTHIFAGDVVQNKKPAPDIYRMVPQQYGLDAAECFVVEDTHIGLVAAKAAGMHCLVTQSLYSRGEDFSLADAVVDNLGERDIPCGALRGLPASTQLVTLDTLRGLLP